MTRLKEELTRFNGLDQSVRDLQDLLSLAEESDESILGDIQQNVKKVNESLREIERAAKLSEPTDHNDALLTIHAGAGGTESCDWAEMLTRMFQRWCERHGFTVEITDIQMGDQAGIKSITFFARGPFAYGFLKGEAGVHRLVRISPFDANKRRHTSFASVDVVADIKDEIDVKIEDKDLRVDTYRAHGAGGQHINKTESAIRITHLPSGIVVACQNQRSQIKNREQAMQVLKARLYQVELDKRRAATEKRYDDKGDIAWGNQIRSYVFMPYQLVKDHRTGYEYSQIEKVMDGDLDAFIDAYLEYEAKRKSDASASSKSPI
jgi:peptide chain release factor 2